MYLNKFDQNEDIINSLVGSLKSEHLEYIQSTRFEIIEENGGEVYTLEVSSDHDMNVILIKNLEKIKNLSCSYIKGDQTKDCDAIFLDFNELRIYFVELKKSNTTSTSNSVVNQLLCGRKWFEHILFVSKLSKYSLDDWQVSYIYNINKPSKGYEGRKSRNCRPTCEKLDKRNSFYKIKTNRINLEYLASQCNYDKFKNFDENF